MFGRADEFGDLPQRVAGLESALQSVHREASELRAALRDAIELALHGTVPSVLVEVLDEARKRGWVVSYTRRQCDGRGTIQLEHPDLRDQEFTIDLPVDEEAEALRKLAAHIRMRIGWSNAA